MTQMTAKNCLILLTGYLGIENTCQERRDCLIYCREQLERVTKIDLRDHHYHDLMRLCDDLIAQADRLAA